MKNRSPFTTIRSEGGLLPADLLSRLAHQPDSLPGTTPDDYHLPAGWRLRDAINRSWTDLQGAWATLQTELTQLGTSGRATTVTRERWLLPLFTEFGYGRLARTTTFSVEGYDYPISHMWGAVPIHLLGADVDLDRRTKGIAGAAGASPHSMVQDLLNRSHQHLWAILSNGRILRILRDNTSLTRAAYVEFDLEDMLTGQVFADFALLWMLCHQSRFDAERPELCWEETWVTESKRQGVRALDDLRTGFEQAITVLGGGFLAHPTNNALRDKLRGGELTKDDYHRQILRVVYRLVFLLVAEDRDLLHPEDAAEASRDLYARYYSLSRLRDQARRHRGTRHGDLWESLKPLFTALNRRGIVAAGVPALGSFLWSPDACRDLDTAHLSNRDLMNAVRFLAYTERERALHKVDFANLGPEELGSVYESLLELHPRIEANAGQFRLLTVAGNERKTTGSYYTPTPLIIKLLDSTLDPVLDEAEHSPDPEAALLSVKVLDPACGSGHFLIAAAQRIATRIATVRTGERIPPLNLVRHALREVVSSCLYGIDLNPMAVELCKVNLWMEAVDPGRPLSFLDNHIVLGNALLGASPDNLAAGIPDNAFKPLAGDDKTTASSLRKRNAAERRGQGSLFEGEVAAVTAELGELLVSLASVADDTPDRLAHKAEQWCKLLASEQYERAILPGNAWCAAFTLPKLPDEPHVTDGVISVAVVDPLTIPVKTRDAIAAARDHYRFLHPNIAFWDVFINGGFDVVLGNPPWLSYSGRQKVAIDAHELNLLGYLYPDISSWPSSHSAFMLRSLQLLKSRGRSGLVAPLQVMHLERYGRLRTRISAQADVSVEDVGEEAFEGVSQRVGLYSARLVGEPREIASWDFIGQVTPPPDEGSLTSEISDLDPVIQEVVSLLRTLAKFPANAFADPGVHTGNVSKLIVSNAFPSDDPDYALVREGRDIAPFYCGSPRKRLWLRPSLGPDQYCTIRPFELYASTPVLLRQTADRPIGCRHTDPAYFRNSLLACRGIAGVPDEVIVAVLNSELIRRWYQADVQESGQRAFPQVKVRNLRRLPLFVPERLFATTGDVSIRDALIGLVRKAEEQQRSSVIDLSTVQEIEVLVCALYGLPTALSDHLVGILDAAEVKNG